MIKLLMPLPKNLYVACSGGVDSMAALDFLRRKHKVTAAFFNHNTNASNMAFSFIYKYCKDHDIGFVSASIKNPKPGDQSLEEYWRNERYAFLDKLPTVVTAHHLNDAVETWVWSSMHGTPKLPELVRGNIYRPFLATPKLDLLDWCTKKNVPWFEDETNLDTKYMRNYIRHQAMPVVNHINPGIQKMIKKKLLSKATTV